MTITLQPVKVSRPSLRNYMRERNPFSRSESSPFTSYVDLYSVQEEPLSEIKKIPSEIDLNYEDVRPISPTIVNLRNKPNLSRKLPVENVKLIESERQSSQVLDTLRALSVGDNLEKFLDKHGLQTRGVQIDKLKGALQALLDDKQGTKVKEIPKWENRLSQMHEFKDSRRLSTWMESVGATEEKVSVPKIQEELQKYFEKQNPKVKQPTLKQIAEPVWGVKIVKEEKIDNEKESDKELVKKEKEVKMKLPKHESLPSYDDLTLVKPKTNPLTLGKDKAKPRLKRYASASKLDDFKGRSLFLQEETVANKIWRDFKDMSAPKQVAVVVGITVATAALGVVSWRLLALTFPSAFSMNGYWSEVLAQWFMQRQESTYNLLMHTAENSKPLSTAWANQYILWKYI